MCATRLPAPKPDGARESDDFAAISAAFKRIKNILRQAEEKEFAIGSPRM